MKVRPIKFRLVLKAVTLLFLLLFLYKRDFKISLFLALLLFALNQNGIGNSVDFFQDQVSADDEVICFLRCYQDENLEMNECDTICSNSCKASCASGLSEGGSVEECNEMCNTQENFQNNNENENENENDNENNVVTTTTQRQPLVSNERGCRIKCLKEDYNIHDCKEKCSNTCLNTCTESSRTFIQCQKLCGN